MKSIPTISGQFISKEQYELEKRQWQEAHQSSHILLCEIYEFLGVHSFQASIAEIKRLKLLAQIQQAARDELK